jgi:hypothetical protein
LVLGFPDHAGRVSNRAETLFSRFHRKVPEFGAGKQYIGSAELGYQRRLRDADVTGADDGYDQHNGPTPPAGFSFGNTYYNFTTTASFSGNLTVCVDYVPSTFSNPSLLQLFHYQGGNWDDVTSSNDTTNGVICGQVTSLSPFAIGSQFEPLTKDNCKEGTWQLWTNPAFKNQGQCIKFVNHS